MTLTLSWRGPLSYRKQPIDLFLYDRDLRREGANKELPYSYIQMQVRLKSQAWPTLNYSLVTPTSRLHQLRPFIPSFSKYAGIYRPNKLPSSKIFCVAFRFPNFSYQKDQAVHSQNLRYLKIKKKFTIIVDYFELKNILNIELIQLGL